MEKLTYFLVSVSEIYNYELYFNFKKYMLFFVLDICLCVTLFFLKEL